MPFLFLSSFSYDAELHLLTATVMPNEVHEATKGGITSLFVIKLYRLQEHLTSASADFAANILNEGSTLVKGYDGSARGPDAQYRHRDVHFPGVIIEISYSQPLHEATKIAKRLIFQSGGEVAVVIIIDYPDYGKATATTGQATNRATLSLWRASSSHQDQPRNRGKLRVVLEIEQEVCLFPLFSFFLY